MSEKEFVMRGQTASYDTSTGKGGTEVLNFSGFKPGYAYKLTEFSLYPSTNFLAESAEICGSITAGKTAVIPTDPNFNNEGLIATACFNNQGSPQYPISALSIVDDTFLITQDLILMVFESRGTPINWQCRFEMVKISKAEEAVTNYKQFIISDD